MKHSKRRTSGKRREAKKAERERAEEYRAIIRPDPLLAEVGKANEHIADPDERERVIPSRPC